MNSSSSEDSDGRSTPQIANENLLPEKSKERYIATYDTFIAWMKEKNAAFFSENLFMAYFDELAIKYKPSSLWAIHSMLKSTLKSKNNVNIEEYTKLTAFLRRQADGYVCKKSKVLTEENIEEFIDQAPDAKYLAIKVALILGVTGALRRQELSDITIDDIEDHGDKFLVKIPNAKNKCPRLFMLQGKYYDILKRYKRLRSKKGTSNRFFQHFRNGKCTSQVIGKNRFGNMPKEIAEYLNLPEANLYTGHSFRRTSATLPEAYDSLKRHGEGRVKTNIVARGCIDDSLNSKKQIGDQIRRTSRKVKSKQNSAMSLTNQETEICASTSFASIEIEPHIPALFANMNAECTSESFAGEPETSSLEIECQCKECGEAIEGFQFWCVQCLGYALCGACEARGAHHTHYVLRAPPGRPHRQTENVLATIRHQLRSENMFIQQERNDRSVNLEIEVPAVPVSGVTNEIQEPPISIVKMEIEEPTVFVEPVSSVKLEMEDPINPLSSITLGMEDPIDITKVQVKKEPTEKELGLSDDYDYYKAPGHSTEYQQFDNSQNVNNKRKSPVNFISNVQIEHPNKYRKIEPSRQNAPSSDAGNDEVLKYLLSSEPVLEKPLGHIPRLWE